MKRFIKFIFLGIIFLCCFNATDREIELNNLFKKLKDSEINEAKKINAEVLLNNEKALNISQLTSLIKGSSFVVANDTGPAHIAAHVGAKGLTLFGKHTTAYKVSIERENFKAIEVSDLNNLSAEKVFEKLNNLL